MEKFEIARRTKFYRIASPIALTFDVLALIFAGIVALVVIRPNFLALFKVIHHV